MYWLPGDAEPRDSAAGQDGAFQTPGFDDVGSPGYAPQAPLRLHRLDLKPAGIEVSWKTESGSDYVVRCATDLGGAGGWRTVAEVRGRDRFTTFLDTNSPVEGQRFYRVERKP